MDCRALTDFLSVLGPIVIDVVYAQELIFGLPAAIALAAISTQGHPS